MTTFALTVVEAAALGTLALAIITVLGALKILPGQRDELRISRVQGAAEIRDTFITTLQRDLERKNAELSRQDRIIAELRTENEGLRRRAGTRRKDATS